MQAAAMRVWNERTSVQSRLTSSRFLRLWTSRWITPAMASATSTRPLAVNRQARLMALLAVTGPAIARPSWARLMRSRRTAAATKAARVRDWVGSRFEVTRAIQSRIDWGDTAAPAGGATMGRRGNPDCTAPKAGSHRVFSPNALGGMTQGRPRLLPGQGTD